jgi:hypothetical protein
MRRVRRLRWLRRLSFRPVMVMAVVDFKGALRFHPGPGFSLAGRGRGRCPGSGTRSCVAFISGEDGLKLCRGQA